MNQAVFSQVRFRILLLVHLIFIQTVSAQEAGFRIQSKQGKAPLAEVSVHTADFSFSRMSDETGFVSLSGMPDSVSRLWITAIGYQTMVVKTEGLSGSLLEMVPRITTLNDVLINASARTGVFKTISDFDIQLRPVLNSQEVLRLVPGLFIGQHAGGGKAEQIFLRGFDLDHGTDINISVDGMPVNMVSHAHGQGYADLHFVIPELIEKVSFNKGPYEVDKGNLTTAGYVAFKTRNYLSDNFIKLEAGQFNTFRAIAAVNLLNSSAVEKGRSLYLAGEGTFSRGYFESPQNFGRWNGMMKYHGKVGRRGTLTALISTFTSKWNASGQIPDRAVADGRIGFFGAIDNDEGGNTGRVNTSLEYNHRFGDGSTLKQQIFHSRYDFELYSNFTFYKEDPINGDQIRQKERRDIVGHQLEYRRAHQLFAKDAHLEAGVQTRYDMIQNVELSRTRQRNIVTAPMALGDIRELNTGVFVEDKIILNPKWDLSAGVRFDVFSQQYADKLTSLDRHASSSIVSPKLKLNWRPNDRLQLYWNNGQGFHSNDARVAVIQNGRDVVTPALGSDLGGILKWGRHTMIQGALWYLWMQQEFVYVGDEGVVEPGGRTRRYGIDLSIRHEMFRHFYADLDLSLASPQALEVPREESFLPLAPRFTSVGGITYRKESGWNGSLRYRYMADRPANEFNSVVAKGYMVTDAILNYQHQRWEAGLSIQNLFNVRWKETQFDTESRLMNEANPVSEIHFTPGTPFFARLSFMLRF